ncbi:hypothetical protein RV10_GL004884 [Enterococcus pallens]|nr:hypothetical protein RV10_GL004884 [Enterococcus pallens]
MLVAFKYEYNEGNTFLYIIFVKENYQLHLIEQDGKHLLI